MAVGTWSKIETYNKRTVKLVGGTTEDTPTTNAELGVNASDVTSCTVTVEADNTRTLSGAGTLDLWSYDYDIGAWLPVYTAAGVRVQLAVTASSVRRATYETVQFPGNQHGRFMYIPNSVTVSAGNLTVYHTCTTRTGADR
jgi:hypothetical protein